MLADTLGLLLAVLVTRPMLATVTARRSSWSGWTADVCRAARQACAAKATSATTDKERMALARKVVGARDTDGLSWLKIGAKFNLAPEADSAKAGPSRGRTLYRLIKGEKPSTGPLIRK